MLHLDLCNGSIFTYKVDDWITLRKTHRILGELIGNTNFVQTLPLKLLPEEALLLHDKNIAIVVENEYSYSPEIKAKYEEFEDKVLEEEQILYRDRRRKQLESMLSEIVTAKRKRGDNRTPEEILNEELEKSCKVTKENMIWPILLSPLQSNDNYTEIPREVILHNTSELKFEVFKDLWEKGYYITSGHKFGGDFLVYLGDPILYHAMFIIHCISNLNESIHSSEITAFGRLATSVKKRAVLSTFNENKSVVYITINWIDA